MPNEFAMGIELRHNKTGSQRPIYVIKKCSSIYCLYEEKMDSKYTKEIFEDKMNSQ